VGLRFCRAETQALYHYFKAIQFLGPTPCYIFTATCSPVLRHYYTLLLTIFHTFATARNSKLFPLRPQRSLWLAYMP